MKDSPLVSIAVLNYNGADLLQSCLDSVLNQTYPRFEVVVVDDGSSDGSLALLERRYPQVRIVRHEHTAGYARAANTAIRSTSADYLVILNNDTRCALDWLEKLMDVMLTDERIGSCGAKQMNFFHPDIIDSAGIQLHRGGFPVSRGRGRQDSGQFSKIEPILGAAGASALYRRAMLEDTGMFDEQFFAYNEEFDLCLRQLLYGWKCLFVPDAVVYHMSGATFARNGRRRMTYYMERIRMLTLIKSLPSAVARENLLFLLKYEWDSCLRLLRGEWIVLLARLAVLQYLPAMLRKRAAVRRRAVISDEEFKRWIVH